jgi:hypothetical protein
MFEVGGFISYSPMFIVTIWNRVALFDYSVDFLVEFKSYKWLWKSNSFCKPAIVFDWWNIVTRNNFKASKSWIDFIKVLNM